MEKMSRVEKILGAMRKPVDYSKVYRKLNFHPIRVFPPPKQYTQKFSYTEEFDRIKVVLHVNSNDHVRVKFTQPFVNLHEKYWSKGKPAPLNDHLVNLKHAGYPDTELERVMRVHMDREQKKPELNDFLIRVFGKRK